MALKALTPDIFGEVRGENPQVLALHGWGRDRTDFSEALDGLSYIAVDLPGFGASPAPQEPWTVEDYAVALTPIVADFSEPPLVVGHSFGGRVAAHLAGLAPLRGVVFVGTPLFRITEGSSKVALGYRIIRWAAKAGLISDSRLEKARQKYGSQDYRAAEGVMRDVLVRAINETYEEQLAKIDVPVGLVWGAQDTAAPLWNVDLAKKVLQEEPEIRIAKGIGHDVHLSRPETLREMILCLL